MSDFDQDIIRRVRIETNVNTDSIKQASSILNNFYKKYQSNSMKVDTSDFFQAIDAVRILRKELDTTIKNSPHMEGIIEQMSKELGVAEQQFEKTMVRFTNGDIATGLNEAVSKVVSGLSIQAVDLGDFLSTIKQNAQDAVDSLNGIGALRVSGDKKFLYFDSLNIEKMNQALNTMNDLISAQKEMDNFYGNSLKSSEYYSTYTTESLSRLLSRLKDELNIIEKLGLNDDQLFERRVLKGRIPLEAYDQDFFNQVKLNAIQDKEQYDTALSYLKEYIYTSENLINDFKNNSQLFTNDEFSNIVENITYNIDRAKLQFQELQQIGKVNVESPVKGDFSKITEMLEEIKKSLQTISDAFKNEDNAMQSMAENGVTSFNSLSEAIVSLYNNLVQVKNVVDAISKKDFSITTVFNQKATSDMSRTAQFDAYKEKATALVDIVSKLLDLNNQISNQNTGLYMSALRESGIDLAGFLDSLDKFNEAQIKGQIAGSETIPQLKKIIGTLTVYKDKLLSLIEGINNIYPNAIDLSSLSQLDEIEERINTAKAGVSALLQDKTQKPSSDTTATQNTASSVETVMPQTAATSRTEAQQMYQLKAAIDEVSNAIGRKNSGFLKEQEIVGSSVEAEKEKLKELVGVLSNDIGGTLDSIKEKFAQAFVVPELDKDKLQTSFDEIYNKFVELKEKIQTMKIDIGINTANITNAIQQALYAKEIAQNYRKADFYDLFVPNLTATWGKYEVINQYTGELFNSPAAAKAEYDEYNKLGYNLFVRKDTGSLIGDIDQVIKDILSRADTSKNQEQDNWAQVIVEAINTQGEKIIEVIKLILPKGFEVGKEKDSLTESFDVFVKTIQEIVQNTNESTRAILEAIKYGKGYNQEVDKYRNESFDTALQKLGLIGSNGIGEFDIASVGACNQGTALSDDYVFSIQQNRDYTGDPWDVDLNKLMSAQNRAYELGANVPRIIAATSDDERVYQLQTRVPGKNHRDVVDDIYNNITDRQIDELIYTLEKLLEVGLYPELGGDNIMYDPDKGFSIIDLADRDYRGDGLDDTDGMIRGVLDSIQRSWNSNSVEDAILSQKVWDRYGELTPEEREQIMAPKIAERQKELRGESLSQQTASQEAASQQNKSQGTTVNTKITPIMDEGAVAKVVQENVENTPATVKITPVMDDNKSKTTDNSLHNNSIVDSAINTQKSIDAESQSAVDAAKQFVDAANAKKEFVEANKLVAESAKTSAEAVKTEGDAASTVANKVQSTNINLSQTNTTTDASQQIIAESEAHQKNTEAIQEETNAIKDLAKEKDVYNNDGELINHEENFKFKSGNANVTEKITENISTDADGNEVHTIMTTIIKDFEAFRKEEEKTEASINKAQAKLDEFVNKFKSKTGGNAQFVEGFKELENFKVNKDNIEDAYNLMTNLQAKYNELEGNFRKGQSSLNPFTNAITKASNIDNIFGEVEYKFNSLENKSESLIKNFNKLAEVTERIKIFINNINSNPSSITPDNFIDFSKDVGEFNLLKTQVEGAIKLDKRKEADDAKKQVEAYQEILRLVKERNNALEKAAKMDDGSIKQRNALTDAYKIQQQLHILGKQIVLTDQQRAELARVREEHLRKIRDIEADISSKNETQRDSKKEEIRAQKVKEYIGLIKQKNDYEAKAAKGGAMQSFYNEKVNELKKQIAQNDRQGIMNQEEKNKLIAIEEEHQRKIAELKAKQDSLNNFQKQNNVLQKKFDAGYLSQYNFDNWKNQLALYQSYLDGTVAADKATIQRKEKDLNQLYDYLNKISNASKTFFAKSGDLLSVQLTPEQIKNAGQSLQELYKSLSTEKFKGMKTAVTSVKESLGRLTFTVDEGKGSLSSYMIQLDSATGAVKLFKVETKDTLTTFKQFGSALKSDLVGMFRAFVGGMSGLYAVGRYIKEGIAFIKELDTALTELKKVTDETEETYDKFLNTAARTGARIGSTMTNVVSATAEFAKLGYNIAEASKMAESALVYTNVGDDVDVETGSQSIISTMKAFGVEANDTMSIVDKFNEVGELIALDNYIG